VSGRVNTKSLSLVFILKCTENYHSVLSINSVCVCVGKKIVFFKAAWGLMALCRFPWQAINLASVFLLLGVGLDDTFVMLAAWRHTDSSATNEERMRECYKEAAVSITITSLTNVLSFFIGALFPGFYCVQVSFDKQSINA